MEQPNPIELPIIFELGHGVRLTKYETESVKKEVDRFVSEVRANIREQIAREQEEFLAGNMLLYSSSLQDCLNLIYVTREGAFWRKTNAVGRK